MFPITEKASISQPNEKYNAFVIIVVFTSCQNHQSLVGQKLYLLDVNPTGVNEVEFHFLDNKNVQLSMSLKVTSIDFDTNQINSITRSYTYTNDNLFVLGYVNNVTIHPDSSGNYQTDNNVTFYHLSIVPILGTPEVKKRLINRMNNNEQTYKFYMSKLNPLAVEHTYISITRIKILTNLA